MNYLGNQIKADRLKLKHTGFFKLHLFLPILGIIIMVGYAQISNLNIQNLSGFYFQIVGIIYPIVIAMVTHIIANQEMQAGNAFNILSLPKRWTVLATKLIYILGFGFIACFVLISGYFLIENILLNIFVFSWSIIFKLILSMYGSVIFTYILHLFLAFYFSEMVSYAFAAFEILIAALMLTGMGNILWIFMPCAWPARLTSLVLKSQIEGSWVGNLSFLQNNSIIITVTGISIMLIFTWFINWQGNDNNTD